MGHVSADGTSWVYGAMNSATCFWVCWAGTSLLEYRARYNIRKKSTIIKNLKFSKFRLLIYMKPTQKIKFYYQD